MGISSVASYNAGYLHPFLKYGTPRLPCPIPLGAEHAAGGTARHRCSRRETLVWIKVCALGKFSKTLSKHCWAGSFPVVPHGEVKKAAQEAGKTAAVFTQ